MFFISKETGTHIVLEGRDIVATMTTFVDPIIRECRTTFISWTDTDRAIYELLLRKLQEFSCFSVVGTFEGSDGGEGIACTASSLVLDWAIKSLFNPIERRGNVVEIVRDYGV